MGSAVTTDSRRHPQFANNHPAEYAYIAGGQHSVAAASQLLPCLLVPFQCQAVVLNSAYAMIITTPNMESGLRQLQAKLVISHSLLQADTEA